MRAAAIGPDTPLSMPADWNTRPFWESLGLIYVPFPSGPVLTSKKQLDAWQRIYGAIPEARQACDPAVADAIAGEHDALSRFVTLSYWLRTEKKAIPAPAALFLPTGEGWTVWEPRPGQAEPAKLRVFHADSLRALGIFLGLLSFLLAWQMGRMVSMDWGFRLWVIWIFGLGMAFIWLPAALRPVYWWPLFAGLVWFCWWLVRFRQTGVCCSKKLQQAHGFGQGSCRQLHAMVAVYARIVGDPGPERRARTLHRALGGK